jgi:uroporphyrin-III C-methyltransferase/precorrin-2 dehydrogenase/sirohydrochlorin ferrochelatase
LPEICSQLISHGMPADTPIALVEKGTLPDQKVHTGTLTSMPEYVKGREIHAPTLTIVGSVVSLHEVLQWRSGE